MKSLKYLILPILLLLTVSHKTEAETARRIILLRGNNWITGIAGFGHNGFSALSGDYRLEGQAAGGNNRDFTVYVTKENLYFSDYWQPRSGTGNLPVFQSTGKDGFFAAAMLEDSHGAPWAAVFHFPAGLDGAGLSDVVFNQLLRAWTGRFLYFLSLSKNLSELSLPAALDF